MSAATKSQETGRAGGLGRGAQFAAPLTLAQAEVFAVADGQETLIALLTRTLRSMKGRDGINDEAPHGLVVGAARLLKPPGSTCRRARFRARAGSRTPTDRPAEPRPSASWCRDGSAARGSARSRRSRRSRREHHHDPVAEMTHDREIVRDEQHGKAELAAQPHQQIEQLRLHRNIETGDDFVGDQSLRRGT